MNEFDFIVCLLVILGGSFNILQNFLSSYGNSRDIAMETGRQNLVIWSSISFKYLEHYNNCIHHLLSRNLVLGAMLSILLITIASIYRLRISVPDAMLDTICIFSINPYNYKHGLAGFTGEETGTKTKVGSQ